MREDGSMKDVPNFGKSMQSPQSCLWEGDILYWGCGVLSAVSIEHFERQGGGLGARKAGFLTLGSQCDLGLVT